MSLLSKSYYFLSNQFIKKCFVFSIILSLFILANTAFAVETKLILPNPANGDSLGYSVDISGNYAIVGAPQRDSSGIGTDVGRAYIYVRSGVNWTRQAVLAASNAAAGDKFGWSVAIDGDYAVVGAPFRDSTGIGPFGTDVGKAYVFMRSGTSWSQQAQLFPSTPGQDDLFGCAVAISGNSVIVGAYSDDEPFNSGAAYVFVRSGASWSQEQKLVASDGASADWFGFSVAISGNYAIAGAYNNDHSSFINAGAAYIFFRSGTTWSQQAKLIANDPHTNAWYGYSVDLDGDKAIVGARRSNVPGQSQAGEAYIYKRNVLDEWPEEDQLIASDAGASDYFGASVSISGDFVVVGAPFYDLVLPTRTNAGAIYSFLWSGTTWTEKSIVTASDVATDDNFGSSVSIDGNYTIVGAYQDSYDGYTNAGSAYIYESIGDLSLPVELLAFTATAATSQVTLNWSTASEMDNVGFILERSGGENPDFVEIASYLTDPNLVGHINSNTTQYYAFVDNGIEQGMTYNYKLFDVDLNGQRSEIGQVQVDIFASNITKRMILHPAFPNPFNPVTTLRFEISDPEGKPVNTRLEIFNTLGQKIKTLFEGKLENGSYQYQWNGQSDNGIKVAGGIYFAILTSGQLIDIKRIVYLR